MGEVGGYFGLELSNGASGYHTSLYKMKSGRSAVSFILEQLKPSHVYIPFFTCDALLEPFLAGNISFTFYAVNNQFEIESMPSLKETDLLIYINYFGLKDDYVQQLSENYHDQLVVDCTQAYFVKGNGVSWFFNSTRKFFGVPDGSDLYIPSGYDFRDAYQALQSNENYITDQLIHRFNGNTGRGYSYFQQNEILNGGDPAKMSFLTRGLLSLVDFEKVQIRRKDNFNYLHSHLRNSNWLKISLSGASVPFFYPYLPHQLINKEKLWATGIFVPVFWNDCVSRDDSSAFSIEKEYSKNLLPLPIDHRYGRSQMNAILINLKIDTANGF